MFRCDAHSSFDPRKVVCILMLTATLGFADSASGQDIFLTPARRSNGSFLNSSFRNGNQNREFRQLYDEMDASEANAEVEEPEFEEDEIETDRDSFTPSTGTAGCRKVIFESAYSFIDNRDVDETHSFPESLIRYGLTDGLELRFGWNYEVGGAGNPISGDVGSFSGEEHEEESEEGSRLLYGFKSRLSEQRDWVPESSLIVQGFTPTSGESNLTQMSATYVFGWQRRNGIVWDFANRFGTSGNDEDKFNTWSPSAVVKIPLGERWKAHAEYFGIFSDGREEESSQGYFSPGAHYLINENTEVGFRVGWGLNNQAANFFSNFGFGWRF